VIYKDDFNTGDIPETWLSKYSWNYITSAVYVNSIYGSDRCIRYIGQGSGGDMFLKKTYQTL